ncbi:MAG: hypothetical protein R2789_14975 [Microthrixaceae bacterium]
MHRPDHWLFEGADVGYGDLLGRHPPGRIRMRRLRLHLPERASTSDRGQWTPADFEILGTAPAAPSPGRPLPGYRLG